MMVCVILERDETVLNATFAFWWRFVEFRILCLWLWVLSLEIRENLLKFQKTSVTIVKNRHNLHVNGIQSFRQCLSVCLLV